MLVTFTVTLSFETSTYLCHSEFQKRLWTLRLHSRMASVHQSFTAWVHVFESTVLLFFFLLKLIFIFITVTYGFKSQIVVKSSGPMGSHIALPAPTPVPRHVFTRGHIYVSCLSQYLLLFTAGKDCVATARTNL